jgi:alpha-amylase
MKKFILTIVSLYMLSGVSLMHAMYAGVPAECEDVMLQAFYWNSYQSSVKYGRTIWTALTKDSTELRDNFDLIWLPPSAGPTGGGVGYSARQYSNQDSDWGRKTYLTKLIAALHRGGTKVLADVVINHRGNSDSWCTFYKDNFGEEFGSYQLTQQHICRYDDGFTNSGSTCYNAPFENRGAADTGTDFDGCRDLDHTSEYVQAWAKAYTQWLMKNMQYDGFRYDMTMGYGNQYLQMYNEAAQPYLSVSEYWGDLDGTAGHVSGTGYNTMVFDFPQKFKFTEAFGGKYGNLKAPGSLRYKGFSRYAVTFIDNHDTFERGDDENTKKHEFIGYNVNLNDSAVKDKILQANAYILMLPGVPCVFWPHWYMYKEVIKELIALRKLAGIHSESPVTGEYGTSSSKYYKAVITGHHGKVELRVGPKRPMDVPEGYHLALEGSNYGGSFTIYISDDVITGVEEVKAEQKGRKFIKDGQLYILYEGQMYDVLGRKVSEK